MLYYIYKVQIWSEYCALFYLLHALIIIEGLGKRSTKDEYTICPCVDSAMNTTQSIFKSSEMRENSLHKTATAL